MQQFAIETPIGRLRYGISEGALCSLDLPIDPQSEGCHESPCGSPTATRVRDQLLRYFDDPKQGFDLPLRFVVGTAYQQRVWRTLAQIPVGTAWSYGQLADHLESVARAVGGACRRNPIPLVLPCHRVVAANGLGGFSGATGGRALEIKYWLLRHEGAML